MRMTYDVPGFCFTVVSSSHTITEIQVAIMKFVRAIPKILSSISVESLQRTISSILSAMESPDISLRMQASRVWNYINQNTYNFSVLSEQIQLLHQGFSKEELTKFATALFAVGDGVDCRLIVVQCGKIEESLGTDKSSKKKAKQQVFMGLPMTTIQLNCAEDVWSKCG
jgi:secreted Zn-dependent insulinase-like peptidase